MDERGRRASGPGTTRVVLLRHGQSTFNAQGRYQGRHDESVLTDEGRDMARRAGRALGAYAFDRILASPLRRAAETAELVAARLSGAVPAVEHHLALREVDIPEWEARAHDTVRRSQPERYREWLERPEMFSMRRRDAVDPQDRFYPLRELHDAAASLWDELLTASFGRSILLVSHGGTIRALVNTALGAPVSRHHAAGKSNCSITELSFDDERRARLLRVNDTGAQGGLLPTWKREGTRLLLWPEDGDTPTLPQAVLEAADPDFWLGRAVPEGVSGIGEAAAAESDEGLLEALDASIRAPAGPHRTGVVTAPVGLLQRYVEALFGLPAPASGGPWLKPGQLSVIDRSFGYPHPVLRALNLWVADAR